MRRTTVLLVCAVVISVPAYPACKPNAGPKNPVVCIDASNNADPLEVKVYSKDEVKFHFTGGHKGRKLEFDAGLVHGYREFLHDSYATGDDVQSETRGNYHIVDKKTGKDADPVIIIEPEIPGMKHHKYLHKD